MSAPRRVRARWGNKEVWPKVMTTVLGREGAQYGVIFAFQVLPTIIFIAVFPLSLVCFFNMATA
jgi:hypothetical protein